MTKKNNKGSTDKVDHVQATRPEPWPGIPARSEDHETELPTGTRRAEQADSTDAQRRLERDMEDSKAAPRE